MPPPPRTTRTLAPAAALSLVWFYEGLWCKVWPGRADHRAIIADLPLLPEPLVTPLLVGIGLAEAAIGLWVLSGRLPYAAAAVQTALIGVFNLGGLLFSPATIDEPGRMLTANLAIVALAWVVAARHAEARS
ncbi:DoxX-like family protein [Nocardiopsis lucentensis]|uniref:DoxX-like family protein n=1 Tax=Nocardiopsis lucentensis TaxID=53441 RepID=UPI000345504A|nr:DoxX-like family protein [Nocardiopsis lucentensis]